MLAIGTVCCYKQLLLSTGMLAIGTVCCYKQLLLSTGMLAIPQQNSQT
jgi:hypothetical protein